MYGGGTGGASSERQGFPKEAPMTAAALLRDADGDRQESPRAAAHEHVHRPAAHRAVLDVLLLVAGGGVHGERDRVTTRWAIDDRLLDHAAGPSGAWPGPLVEAR